MTCSGGLGGWERLLKIAGGIEKIRVLRRERQSDGRLEPRKRLGRKRGSGRKERNAEGKGNMLNFAWS